jgi:hypothetical protein
MFKSRQPVWRLLIFLRMIEKAMGISLLKGWISKIKTSLTGVREKEGRGFSLIKLHVKR